MKITRRVLWLVELAALWLSASPARAQSILDLSNGAPDVLYARSSVLEAVDPRETAELILTSMVCFTHPVLIGQCLEEGQDLEAAARASCLFFDGTFFSGDELRQIDPNAPRAESMAHLPIGGPQGSLARLGSGANRFYIHVNNTNPILDEDSVERATLAERGIEVAFDGMEIEV